MFYAGIIDRVPEIAALLHQPADEETVAVLVSDRHDNIGMDEVVRAVADEAGATAVISAGDDTSNGQTWEAFSLDSLDKAFEDYDAKVAVSGNHDHGTFVNRYLEKLAGPTSTTNRSNRSRGSGSAASTTRGTAT